MIALKTGPYAACLFVAMLLMLPASSSNVEAEDQPTSSEDSLFIERGAVRWKLDPNNKGVRILDFRGFTPQILQHIPSVFVYRVCITSPNGKIRVKFELPRNSEEVVLNTGNSSSALRCRDFVVRLGDVVSLVPSGDEALTIEGFYEMVSD
ncbi:MULTISPECIES: hypothetical protein [Alphaproteobacteria]|uniref:hypothetical protein n=1 Tax=Alphaproteobacteria TaxID=28211 RepID=UPI003263EEB2